MTKFKMSRGERDIPYVEKDELSNIGCQWGRSERSKIHRGKIPKWVGAGGVRRKGSRSHVGEKTYEERPGHHRRHDRKVRKIKHRRPDQIPD